MFEKALAMEPTPISASLLQRIGDASRAEAQAAAERLVAVADLFEARLKDSGEREDWAIDTRDAVAAQVAATLRVSVAMGASYLHYAEAMRQRLPQVGRVFEAGDIDFRLFRTIVFRTDLITDTDILATVDAQLAVRATRWPSMTGRRLAAAIDKWVAPLDPDAVRRVKNAAADRYVEIGETDAGMAEVRARVFDTTGKALDKRLDELADTVCDADPRSRDLRRADGLAALAAGADRLVCTCGADACPADTAHRPPSNVVIHVVGEQATLNGTSQTPGYTPGADWLIPADVLREIATAAKLLPIIAPLDAPPEGGYVPSRALADYVRHRDLTCRAPGCDRPAAGCDLDHTVPYCRGGQTHASNIKCLCRFHHLMKTFWGWKDQQLPDGTVIWTLPGGQVHVTTPGSALLFPALCAPTGSLPDVEPASGDQSGNREAMMPRRTRTRAQNRAHAIADERRLNHEQRLEIERRLFEDLVSPDDEDDPPPF
jgi:hypothetical protein